MQKPSHRNPQLKRTNLNPEKSHRSTIEPLSSHKKISTSPLPSVIIFDVDGVLVNVRESFQRTTLQTVKFFTGKRVSRGELHRWKNRSGFNDDWKLTTAWVRSLGRTVEFEEVKRKFVEFYWGNNKRGNVAREKWILKRPMMRRLASIADLAIFTGRTLWELDHTIDRYNVRGFFKRIIVVEDVEHPKPHPEGLLKILDGREPATALYLGDNVDDALAAKAIGMPFVGVLPRRSEERRHRVVRLRRLGALVILGDTNELEGWLKKRRP
jgi:HAD superfamily hydrolase (TIGR01548 family)